MFNFVVRRGLGDSPTRMDGILHATTLLTWAGDLSKAPAKGFGLREGFREGSG